MNHESVQKPTIENIKLNVSLKRKHFIEEIREREKCK